MGNNVADETSMSNGFDGSETTIEIKIKTLDAQTYTLRVDKQMPVPALKQQIASVTGVLSEQQRLICRGKVLKDDQLLSAYHVEDGHTLHMVVRQPLPPSESLLNNSASEPNSSSSHGFSHQIAPGVVIETFSLPMQGDGVPPEINRIVSAVLGSIGLSNVVSGSTVPEVREPGQQRQESISGANSLVDSNQHQSVEARRSVSIGQSTPASLGSMLPPVIPDSLTTLSHYINHLRSEFDAAARDRGTMVQAASNHGTEGRGSNSATTSGAIPEGLPTPASLAEVMLSTRQILVEAAGECLLQLAGQLENQVNVTDPTARVSTQSSAWRTGVLFHNLGALLLELGRTVMTLRMGQSPSEAVVNAGPAVFISQSAPNPIMVQPLPFQTSSNSSVIPSGMMQPGSSLIHGLGTGFLPRRIDIQIRRGSSTTPNSNREEQNSNQQPLGQRESIIGDGENLDNQANTRLSDGPFLVGESGVRVVPVRTVIAAVSSPFSRLPLDSSNNSTGLYYPLLGRFQQPASGGANGEQGNEASGERDSIGPQAEQHSVSDFDLQQLNVEDLARDGSSTPGSIQQVLSNTRSVNINVGSASGVQNNRVELPDSVVNFLRTVFPSGQIREEDASMLETAPGSVLEHEMMSNAVVDRLESESGASDDGIFLSNLLRRIIPHISQQIDAGHVATAMEDSTSEPRRYRDSSTQSMNGDVGTSHRQSENETDAPCSKRQKTE